MEIWLWHGSEAVDVEAESGVKIAHANRTSNLYGASLFFNADPHLAHWEAWIGMVASDK